MTNPFDDNDARFIVLVNDEGQHSLWPHAIPTPDGWSHTFGPDNRTTCLNEIETHWVDMRPRSLVDAENAA
ncbi:MbtH family protein [Oleiagrimonas soli]|uniref:MbtH family protein n=1 Tax=Oleiagrimonas soli TaxID=1543381 RepID=UPI0009DD06F4|nr:MbtH family protein [Oleiagrimonas soli]